jgi:O-antigen/teichoic acid export membrane protein
MNQSRDANARAPGRRQTIDLVGSLTAANVATVVLSLVSGPLLARSLGADGRGTLAAILVPVTLAPWIVAFGLGTYATREAARGKSPAELIGSLAPALLLIGVATAAVGPVVADLIANGRETVYVYLIVGFCITPLALVGYLLLGIATGLERWRTVIAARLIAPGITLVALCVLYATGSLTVASAAVATFAGGVVTFAPLASVMRATGRPTFRYPLLREAVPFGLLSWVAGLGTLANLRLDQLFMTRLVDARELGLYVVAATLATGSTMLTGALSSVLQARAAVADSLLTARILRVTLPVLLVFSALLVPFVPFLLGMIFGKEFEDATSMTLLLLAAAIPLAGVTIVSVGLTSAGHPSAAAFGEGTALVVTLPGLVLLLPILGGEGAALVSLVAYSLDFVVMLYLARSRFGCSLGTLLVCRREDVQWARAMTLRGIRGATERAKRMRVEV